MRRQVFALFSLLTLPATASAETCRFEGSTSYGGRLAIVADSVANGREVSVDVRLQLDADPLPLFHTHYLMQEISTADRDGIERIAVNSRYSADGRIIRQGWDIFDRSANGLQAHRIEGKRAGQFARQHPLFSSHWEPASFGRPWVQDFLHASPERRSDLDLHEMSASVRPALAMAFYWLRWLPEKATVAPVFLPGFKDRKRVDIAIGARSPSGQREAPLLYPDLDPSVPSTASAWIGPGRQLLQLLFDLHGTEHSARATIRAAGCIGTVPPPP